MGQGKQNYVGTSANGLVNLQGSEVQMPGLPTGYYTARVVHTASGVDVSRGFEIADDVPSPNRLLFDVAATNPRTR